MAGKVILFERVRHHLEKQITNAIAEDIGQQEKAAAAESTRNKLNQEIMRALNLRACERLIERIEDVMDRIEPRRLVEQLKSDAMENDGFGKRKIAPFTSHVLLWKNKRKRLKTPIADPKMANPEMVSLIEFREFVQSSDGFRRLRNRLGDYGLAIQAFPMSRDRSCHRILPIYSGGSHYRGYGLVLSFSTERIWNPVSDVTIKVPENYWYNRVSYTNKVTVPLSHRQRLKRAKTQIIRFVQQRLDS